MSMNLDAAMYNRCLKRYKELAEDSSFVKNIPFRHGVFGGAVRSWFLGRKPRDIDIAIECSTEELNGLLTNTEHTRNSFGGTKIQGNIEIDVWPLSETWNLQNEKVMPTFENLASFASLNVDCLVLEVGIGAKLISRGFIKALLDGVVEINYKPNPSPASNALRGLRLCNTLKFRPGPMLKEYALEHLDLRNIPELCKKYGEPSEQYVRMVEELLENR